MLFIIEYYKMQPQLECARILNFWKLLKSLSHPTESHNPIPQV